MVPCAGIECAIRKCLKALGIIDESQIRASAFARLQREPFRLWWVEGVGTHGFERSVGRPNSGPDAAVLILTTEISTLLLQQEADRILAGVNCRYGTCMRAAVVGQAEYCA